MANFITISYRRIDGDYFPQIISDESMTGAVMKEAVGASFSEPHIGIKRDGIFQRFWDETDMVNTRTTILAMQLKKNMLPEYTNIVQQHFTNALKALDADIGAMSGENLWETYSAVCNEYRNMCVYTYVANLLDRPLVDSIKAGLNDIQSGSTQERKDDYLLKLSRNPAANFLYNHDLELIALLLEPATEDQLKQHADKWQALFHGGSGSAGYEDALKRISDFKSLSSIELESRKKHITEQYTEAADDIKKIEQELNLPDQLKIKLNLLRDCILLKETRKFSMTSLLYKIKPLFSAIGKMVDVAPENVSFLLPTEIQGALLGTGRAINNGLIDGFRDNLCYIIERGETKRYTGPEVDRIIDRYNLAAEMTPPAKQAKAVATEQPDSFNGFVSCLGYIEGPVKIVYGRKDFEKIKPGDILVTPLTTPEYISIFNMVAGMITFDGAGLTSHPATLSREYKIPAILGVKELDGVLHDNDIVAVDANKNSIKIIKRADS